MKKKISFDSIKKYRQNIPNVYQKKKNLLIGETGNYCSTFLSFSGLLAQGEWNNPKKNSRNAVVRFRDLKTGNLKGEDFRYLYVFIKLFVVCFLCNTPR